MRLISIERNKEKKERKEGNPGTRSVAQWQSVQS